ncbi:MAG TPA: EscU/YscU/HrcU family type III secretion system export apparatus switch protein, partial [Nannocystaceae bacterium]|nr:EscU/YscU/HrcU family type III secretion system export apparatus switch protein [Nannocystaceae bacterium]
MASDDKTEEPTQKRRDKFREDGRVASSRDIGAVAVGIGTLGLAYAWGPAWARGGEQAFVDALAHIAEVPAEGATALPRALAQLGSALLGIGAPVCLVLFAITIAAGVVQTGGLWSNKLLTPSFDRMGFVKGLARMFSGRTVVELLLSVLKAAAIGGALWWAVADEIARLPALATVTLEVALSVIGELLARLAAVALIVGAGIAALDYIIARNKLAGELRMTKQEIKDEVKQQEGDPLVRQRMRARMRTIGRNRMLAAVRRADVVVVNPTHYAVALGYQVGQSGAPRLLAKGVD